MSRHPPTKPPRPPRHPSQAPIRPPGRHPPTAAQKLVLTARVRNPVEQSNPSADYEIQEPKSRERSVPTRAFDELRRGVRRFHTIHSENSSFLERILEDSREFGFRSGKLTHVQGARAKSLEFSTDESGRLDESGANHAVRGTLSRIRRETSRTAGNSPRIRRKPADPREIIGIQHRRIWTTQRIWSEPRRTRTTEQNPA